VVAKSLGFSQWVWVVAAAVIGTLAYTELLKSLGSALPALDGATVVISIVAQVLMVLRYREQWVLWIVVNILTISSVGGYVAAPRRNQLAAFGDVWYVFVQLALRLLQLDAAVASSPHRPRLLSVLPAFHSQNHIRPSETQYSDGLSHLNKRYNPGCFSA
jgi:hypothetical protein